MSPGRERLTLNVGNLEVAVLWHLENECIFSFTVYQAVSWSMNSKRSEWTDPLFKMKEATSLQKLTEDLAKAEPMLEGIIKWDGCSEIEFFAAHFCNKKGATDWAELIAALYDLAREKMGPEVVYNVKLFEGTGV